MQKNLLTLLFLAALIPATVVAEWVPIKANKNQASAPEVTLLSSDLSSTVIKIDISGFDLSSFSDGKTEFHKVDLLNEIFYNKPGHPAVPYIAEVLAIPDQSGISVEVIEMGESQIFSDIHLQPARASWFEGQPESFYECDQEVYSSDVTYPNIMAEVDQPSVYRDFRIARVSAYPISYNPQKKELIVHSTMTIKVNYGGGEVINPKTTPHKSIAPSYGSLYRSSIFNYQEMLDLYYGGKEEGHELMLCIMPDLFEDEFEPYAKWKRESGIDIHVTVFSDIGANSSDPTIIKDHILDAYNNWDIVPTYVLIIGDDGVFPKKIVTYDYSFPNEDYFVELEGNDHFPEMMIGRFTNQGEYRLQVMINKFLMYEQTPYTGDMDWFKHGVCCSNNAYQSQVTTKEFVAGVMMEAGQFTAVDEMMSDGWGSGCTYDLGDVIDVINEGRSHLNYRGEGWSSGWSANCYGFSTSDVYTITNGEQFTFVTSIGCGVAMFDTWGDDNCFGEAWVEMGTLDNPRGASAFIGPTSNTHTTYNNKIDKGIYVGMFEEQHKDTPGLGLGRGRLYVYNVYGNDPWVEYHFRVYCVLGDPSIHIWKDYPQNVSVDYPPLIQVGNNIVEVTVTNSTTGDPMANATVCITGDEIFAVDSTNSEGIAFLDITPDENQTLTLTVRGGNVYPVQETIEVSQPLIHVVPEPNPVIDDVDGNNDGLINPNENGTIAYTLKNWGNLTANNVEATLSSTNSLITINTGTVNFGNLSPGASSDGDPFEFFIDENCPVGISIDLQLDVTSGSENWTYNYDLVVRGCQLMIDQFVINDLGNPDPNYKLDPGETVHMYISINNAGEDFAPDVMGTLTTSDPYITIEDAESYFGSMPINSIAMNNEDYVILSVDASCPTTYLASCTLQLYTNNGLYPYEVSHLLDLPVTLPIEHDYTGPDAYGYYMYSSTDLFFEETPEYNWVEISQIGTPINIPGGISDYTQTVNLPFEFTYYGIDYNVVRISTDGWFALGAGSETVAVNTGLPANDNVNNMVGVMWDDLYVPGIGDGDILYLSDPTNHRFIIQWDSIHHNDPGLDSYKEDFQAILLDPAFNNTATGDGEIILQYNKVEAIQSATVGMENHSQNDGLQYLYDEAYDATANEIHNGFALKITTDPPFLNIVTSEEENPEHNKFQLGQNIPNPFTHSTTITYFIPKPTVAELKIFNINGELVKYFEENHQVPGNKTIVWDGTNNEGVRLDSGVYFYQIEVEGATATKKMFLLR